jgi:hypothetical protein
MTDNNTRVDVLSLEDFHATLGARLAEATAILTKLETELRDRPPALGTFEDGQRQASDYSTLYQQHVERAGRLKSAIEAAQAATATIIANYHSTEELNRSSAIDIGNQLGGVKDALDGGQRGA